MNDQKINLFYIISAVTAVFFTWILHEFTHWFTSESLGYESILRLNTVLAVNEQSRTEWHKVYISASGPIITILQATITFLILSIKGWNKFIYPFLFVPFYMRFLAGLMNFINPNDEGRISEFLGIGTFTLSIIVCGLLFYFIFNISRKYNLNWKFQTLTTLIVMITSSILILSDMHFGIRIL